MVQYILRCNIKRGQSNDRPLIYCPNSQKAIAAADATFKESTSWDIGILTV